MDSENIASILKDAINASTTKIQNESKRTKVFVLPPELLKGLLIQNEIPKVDNTPKPETSTPKNSKETIRNKNQSLEDSDSTTLPVDQPKRACNRRAPSKGSKNTRSRRPSKNNSKDLKNKEQNHEQNTVLESNETSDISQSTEKITVHKKSSRRKSKARKESEPSYHCSVESNSNTTLNEVQEKIEINHELQDDSVCKVSNKTLDNYCLEQSSSETSDKIEQNCIDNNYELQDCPNNQISNDAVYENNLANTETAGSSFVEKSCDEILKVADSKTELDDQVLENPCIDISQSDASQNILSGEKSLDVELNDEKQGDVLSSEPIQLLENQEIIEETYILEEIIELGESDEDSTQVNNDKVNILEEVNIKTEKDLPVEEIKIKIEESFPAKEINSKTEGDLPVNDIDVSKPIDNLLNTKTKCISKKVPVSFKPIVEQKRPNAVRVYINRRKNRHQPSINDVQERFITQTNHNCDETSSVDNSLKESTLENSHEVSQSIKQLQEKTNLETNCDFEHNSLIDTVVTETSIASPFEELKFSREIQEKSNLAVERISEHKDLIDSTPKTDQLHEKNNTQEAQEEINVKTNCSFDQIILDSAILPETSDINSCKTSKQEETLDHIILNSAILPETSNVNSCKTSKHEEILAPIILDSAILPETSIVNSCKTSMQVEIVSVSENISIISNKEKTDDENKILNPIEEVVENLSNHTESKEEIQSIDINEKTINTRENLINQTEHVEIKIQNTQTQEKSDNVKIDAQSSSTIANIVNEKMETDAENTKNSEFPKYSTDDNVNNDIEKNIDIASDKIETEISHNNDDPSGIQDYLKNENDCPIKSLRQLRNRTKVIPKDPVNFHKLKNNIEQESLHLRNGDKSDIALSNNFEISHRTRSVSLNLDSNSPEKLSTTPKKVSRKTKSIDNYSENANRISFLRRRSSMPENETKLPSILEHSDTVQSSESSSNETVNREKDAVSDDSDQSKALKDVDCTTMQNSASTEVQKAEEIIQPESNLTENLSINTDELQNTEFSLQTAINKRRASLKNEKVIVVRKIQKGRRSKSSQPKDDPAVTTDMEKRNGKSDQIDNNSTVPDEPVNTHVTAKNEISSKDKMDGKSNDSALDSSNFRKAVEENALKIKTEKVTPVKSRRGTRAKPIPLNEITVENTADAFDTSHQPGSASDLINHQETSNADRQVENALEETSFKIKTEKVTPVKKSRGGRRSKSTTNELAAENAKGVFNINENGHQLENADGLVDQLSQKADEDTMLSKDSLNKTSECTPVGTSNADHETENVLEESIYLNIQTEKITYVKKGRRGRRPKYIPSIVNTQNTKDNVDVSKNSHESEGVSVLNCSEQASMNVSTAICNKKAEENIVFSSDNLDSTLESTSVDASIGDPQIENVVTEDSVETKSEKVSAVKRGRKGRRSKIEKHHEDDKNNTSFEASEYFSATDSTVTNDIVTSTDLQENGENVIGSDDLNEKSECNVVASADSSPNVKPQKTPPVKKGRRGRPPKRSQVNDSIKEKEIADNDVTPSFVESNVDLEKDNVMQHEEADKDNSTEKCVNIIMEIDRTTDDNNATHDNNLDTIGTNDEVTEEPTKGASKLSQRTSRQSKEEPSLPDSMQHSKRSSRNSAKRNRMDSDDEPENDSSSIEIRKSGRRQRSKVNYCVPDEDVDVIASEARREPSENAPKRRRGRPSMAELLRRKTAAEAAAKENAEIKSRESTHEDTNLDSTANDSVLSHVDAGNTLSKRRRTVKSSINEDIFEVESETGTHEKSLDSSDKPQAESVSDAENDTNDFEDSHFSDKSEDEDFAEEPKPRRGRKRKGFFNPYKARKRGRPKKNEVESNDEEYTPHHTYVPQPTKVKEPMKSTPDKKVVKCGKCGKEIARHQWYSHNLFTHNDMAWMEGASKPDFENDQKLLTRVLTYAHKKKNKKGLVCEMCREVKRSVVGFISHITFCGKTDEEIASLLVTCEICGGTFKPSSMEYHERQHRLELDVKKKKEKEMAEKVVDPSEPRSKRKAAEKAVTKISEFTATVKDDFSDTKKLKLNSPHIKKFIQKPLATKKISSFTIAKWKKEFDSGADAACTQLGCEFTCKSMEEMRGHYSTCNFTVTENYVCKICRFQTLSEDEIIQHAQKHTFEDLDGNAALSSGEGSSDEDYTDVDEDSSNHGLPKTQGLVKKFFYKESSDVANKMFKFIFNNGACHTILSKTFLSGVQWTLEFERKHFKFNIFNNFVPNIFTLLDEKDAEDYLPELDTSIPVRFTETDGQSNESEWKNWSRFEGSCVDDSPTFFVGGPIWAMAWAPTPSFLAISDDLPQFLAVSTHPTMDSEYAVGKSYSGKNIIQIWNVGILNNRDLSKSDPELSYAITHDGGTVWSLEWCPSGCYQHEDFPISKGKNDPDRLGLLAAGCSDGCVRIYSLIFPIDLLSPSENQYPIYKTEPVAKLIINTAIHDKEAQTWQVMKLCWSREAGHNVIVAGFSNGYVACWDLTTKSPLLKYQVDNTTYFRPYKQFFAHHHAVTMVALVPQDNKRYLATASLDKLYKFWDLEDISRPKNTFKKSYVTDGCWFNNWGCAVLAHDEALCMGHNATVCLPLRDYTYKYYNLLPSNSTTYAVATSDFGNSLATGNVAGELLTLFPHQIIYIRDMEKTIPPKRSYSLVSTTDIVDFQAEPKNDSPVKKDKKGKKSDPYSDPANFMPSTYKDSKGRFGIQFNNYMNAFHSNSKKKQKHTKKQLLTCEHLSKVPIEQYPLKSINKVAWNPNATSFLWLAAGYQNGFVRLISFRSVASTVEWNKLLQSHTNEMKAQMSEEAAEEEDC